MPEERADLAGALRAATVAVRVPGTKIAGTGFFVAPGLVLTCAHVVTVDGGPVPVVLADDAEGGEFEVVLSSYVHDGAAGADLVLLRAPAARTGSPVLLSAATAPGDELWAFGCPDGNYRAGEPVALSLDGTSAHVAGPALLKATHGRIQPGMSGAPVLNWRTGAVCGVVRYRDRRTDDTARFVPVETIFATYPELATFAAADVKHWLDLATDAQLASAGVPYPGPKLRRYLRAASAADENHPYAGLLEVRPPLSKVYLRQHLSGGEAPRAEAGELVSRYAGLQIFGGPGAGKSSLARHLTAVAARRWLDEGRGDHVPILVPAEALSRFGGGLADLLAEGVVRVLHTDLDRATLVSLFSEPPFPGGDWLVFVDGVDEVIDPAARGAVLAKIARHRSEGRYRFALTTRPLPEHLVAKVAADGSFPTFTIEPFGEHELGGFAVNWFSQLDLPDPAAASEQFRRRIADAGIGHLATIPLIATMMCILFAAQPDRRLPGNRAELYGQFIEHLLVKRKLGEVREHLVRWTKRSGPQAESAAEELLERTPELLETVAYEEYAASAEVGGPGYRLDPVAVLARHVTQPANMSRAEWDEVLREVLRSCGLFVEHRGRFAFIHQTLQEYLAAAHLARHHPDPRRLSARRQVAPQDWPWRGLEVKVFLAGLWAARGRDLERLLMRLLNRRNRDQNYRYLVELHRQQVELPAKVAVKLRALLAQWVADDNLTDDQWRPAVDAFVRLDPTLAVAALRESAGPGHRSQRRLDAALLLAEFQPQQAFQALGESARDRELNGAERLRAAKALLERAPQLGAAALTSIGRSAEADEQRVDAALVLAKRDAGRATELLVSIAQDRAASDLVRLSAGRLLEPRARSVVLAELAADHSVTGVIRLEAAAELDARGDAAGTALLVELAGGSGIGAQLRLQAAEALAQTGYHGVVDVFRAIAFTKRASEEVRAAAAEAAVAIDPAAVRWQLDLVADPSMGDARISTALSAGVLEPKAAADALVRLLQPYDTDTEFLIQAATTAAELDRETGLAALWRVLRETDRSWLRLKAARAIDAVDDVEGLAAFAELSDSHRTNLSVQVAAAQELWLRLPDAGRQRLVSIFAWSHSGLGGQIASAAAIAERDRTLGIMLLREIALNSSVQPKQRLEAAKRIAYFSAADADAVRRRLANDDAVAKYLDSR
ncbi:trypsin-like peptidase domain-containing protein [Amycolatopsis sp. NPDC051903]|uniref:trypsin-like peptidase domain-containing protein n=1 Tax=Amycolatopsis sp. NPDC051903 TaxID=3363936 RepID=UPI0037926ACC